jgi:rhodanese-related sulfurtransferase
VKSLESFIIVFIVIIQAAAAPVVKTITADSLQKLLNNGTSFDFLLIDVRETSELDSVIATENCHPYNLPYTSHVINNTLSKLPKSIAIILYCQSGGRSANAARLLDSNGFTLAYSLAVGFSNWNGPVKAASFVKPTGDLPAPSMLKTSGVTAAGLRGESRAFEFRQREGRISVIKPLSITHTLSFYTMHGKCAVQEKDPFRSRMVFNIPAGLPHGVYAVDLQVNEKNNLLLITLTR